MPKRSGDDIAAEVRGVLEDMRRIAPRQAADGGVFAEVMHNGTWLEITGRVAGGRIVHRSGWAVDEFGEARLQEFTERLEKEVARMDRRHLKLATDD